MAGIDDVMERLVADAEFRTALARDPGAALMGYDLTRQDLELLASRLDESDDVQRTVEQRTSKSALLSLVASLGDVAGGVEAEMGEDAVGDDLVAPTGDGETFAEANVKVEYEWNVEPGEGEDVEMDDLTHKVDRGDDAQAIELENAQISSYQLGVVDSDAPPDAGDPDAPIVTGRLPNGEQQEGIAVPGSDLMEPTEADGEDELPQMPNPADLTDEVAPSDDLATGAEVGIDAVAGDAGEDPLPDEDVPDVVPTESFAFTYEKMEWDAEADVAMEELTVEHEAIEPASSPPGGDDVGVHEEEVLASRPAPDDQDGGQFEIQDATSDLQNAEDVPSAAAEEPGAGVQELKDDVFEIGDA